MKLFRFYSRYWAAIGGLVFVGLAFVLGIMGDQIPTLQRLTVLLFMALLFHQFEEYVFPGGFPAAGNMAPIMVFRNRETTFGFAKHEADDFAVRHGIASLWRKDK